MGRATPVVVVVGCGAWGRNHARVLAELGALHAVCDADEARAAEVAATVGRPVATFDETIRDPEVAAVVIATPPGTHFDLARRALRAGKDTLVEKPLALDLAHARELCTLANDTARVLMVGHLMRYHPAFTAMAQLVAEGRLGRTQYLYSNRLNLGMFRREESILWSFAPHDVSMILTLVGSQPESIYATGSAYLHKTIADVTTTHLWFPAGERAHIFVSWLHPVKEQKLVIIGDGGMAVFDDTRPWAEKLVVYDHRVDWRGGKPQPVRAEANPVSLTASEPLLVECQHFLHCVTTRSTPLTDGREGMSVLAVLDQAQRSLEAQQQVSTRALNSRAFVHPSAYVDDDVTVGVGTKVWHFCHLMSGSTVGRDCNIGQNVVIGPNVTIGDRVSIQNNVSVYEGVVLEDGVFCGPSCVFTNVLNPRAEVDRRTEFQSTIVRRGATIGANATILCGNEIGEFAFIAAGAVVTADVHPHAVVAGVPARQIGWASHDGEVLGDELVCPRSGRRYEIRDGDLIQQLD